MIRRITRTITRKIFPIEREDFVGEPEEIGIDESAGWIRTIQKAFPALEERNFAIYFSGQFVSLIGTWLQTIAQGWLVLQLTHSAFWVGVVSACQSLPVLLFVLFTGVIVDRMSRKKILLVTQSLSLLFALILGLLTISGYISVPAICLLAFLLGTVNALDVPARHTFIAEMMGNKNLASAIALHSAAFNGSRVIGPAVAGLLIALIGTGGTFLVNAASFLAVIASLFLIQLATTRSATHSHPLDAIREGISYAFSRTTIRMFLIGAGIVSIFGWSYVSILPVEAEQVFHQQATGLGYLYTAAGIGALLGAILVSTYLPRTGPRTFILAGNALLGTSLFLFSFASVYWIGLICMFFLGLAFISEFSVINSTIQNMIQDQIRGRVMSIYVLMWQGMTPFGSFLMGTMAQHFGAPFAIRFGSLFVLGVAFYFFLNRTHIPRVQGIGIE